MVTGIGTNGGPGRSRRPGAAATLGLAYTALLCLFVVAATLASVASPAGAATVTTTIGSGPASLSGTISYVFSYAVPGNCPGCRTSESLRVTIAVVGAAISANPDSPSSYWDNPDVYRCVRAAAAGSNCFWAPLTVKTPRRITAFLLGWTSHTAVMQTFRPRVFTRRFRLLCRWGWTLAQRRPDGWDANGAARPIPHARVRFVRPAAGWRITTPAVTSPS